MKIEIKHIALVAAAGIIYFKFIRKPQMLTATATTRADDPIRGGYLNVLATPGAPGTTQIGPVAQPLRYVGGKGYAQEPLRPGDGGDMTPSLQLSREQEVQIRAAALAAGSK